MTGDFLPQYSCIPTATGWRPSYKLFVGQREKLVPGAAIFPTPAAAVKAAMEYVQRKLNPPIRSEVMETEADILGIEEWREQKAREAEEERAKVLGAEGPQTVFSRHGKPVVVERRRARV